MTYDELMNQIAKDFTDVDIKELGKAAVESPKLQGRYYNLYLIEKRKLTRMEAIKSRVYRILREYYHPNSKITDEAEVTELGLNLDALSYDKTLLVGEVERYIDSDPNWIRMNKEYSAQKDMVEIIEQIMKYGVKEKNFAIRSAIEDERWKSGS